MGHNNKPRTWFIIFGDSGAGKTALQKSLALKIIERDYKNLPSNKCFDVLHAEIRKKYEKVFFGGQSFQEQAYVENEIVKEYKTFMRYLLKHKECLKKCPLAFIPSQLISPIGLVKDLQEMLEEAKDSFQVDHVHALGLTNSLTNNPIDSAIKKLDWDDWKIVGEPQGVIWDKNQHFPSFENKRKKKQELDNVTDIIIKFILR